jgi:DNA-binding CsgD family transcriptional regulator
MRGKSYKDVAAELCIAPATARNHIQNIHEKLGARTNAEVAVHLLQKKKSF